MVVNMVDFVKRRQMAPLDLLLSCLATSRICVQLTFFLEHLVLLSFINESVFHKAYVVFMFVNDWGLWMATWLGVFYCAKIATIPHTLFFWLKRRISRLVPWLILGSTLYVSVTTGIQIKYTWNVTQNLLVKFFSRNTTEVTEIYIMSRSLFLIHLTVPLIIFLIAVLLLTYSLGRHIQKLRTMAVGTRDPCGPFIALLSILSFLILYFSYYVVNILNSFEVLRYGSFLFVFCTLLTGSYPSVHSVILILGNAKLKQNAKKFLLCGQCGH
nr:taste receptor type 2 member 119-like [Cavia porcellus]